MKLVNFIIQIGQHGTLTLVLMALCLPVTAQNVAAEAKNPISVFITLQRVEKDAKGKEVLTEAATVKPGDVVEYKVVYANNSDQSLGNVQAALPIPEGMEYVGKSALPASALASVDGKEFAPEPLKRTFQDKDGKVVTEEVSLAEYRALRWQIESLQPGKEYVVKARARVSTTPPAPPKK